MSNKLYTVFNSDGSCKCQFSVPGSGPDPIPSEGEILVKGQYDGNKVIYLDGVIVDKPKSSITLTGTKLENLPNPTTVTITGNGATFREIIEDGEFEFSVDTPGKYTIKCESRVELPIEFKVVIK